MRADIIARAKPCDVEPPVRLVNQRWGNGVELNPTISTQIRYNTALQTNGSKKKLKSLSIDYPFCGIKQSSVAY